MREIVKFFLGIVSIVVLAMPEIAAASGIDDILQSLPTYQATRFIDSSVPGLPFLSIRWLLIIVIALMLLFGVVLPILPQLIWSALGVGVLYILLEIL